AHIGVLRALDEIGIVPDIVAGTSIGAVVGGCYLAGKLDELEEFARRLTKRRVFGLLDISLAGSGLISGLRLQDLFAKHLENTRMEALGRKFVCVATELGTGHEIWQTQGRIIDAMRASYALPGIFEPIRVDHRWLVDGALVNPVPVSVCRAFGARVVIAVNLHSDVFGRGTVVYHEMHIDDTDSNDADQIGPLGTVKGEAKRFLKRQFLGQVDGPPGIPTVMFEAFNIIQDRIARSRLAGDPPDLMLGPKLGPIGLFEFHRAEEAIAAGYETTIRMADEMRDMVVALA
ncbi:MAG: patatin-like phospholipase family protein, partial [Hyphomicrobiales bacterium]|nr:patatin-like phospholipase family protein [Hyphomicrobiales bacterium]